MNEFIEKNSRLLRIYCVVAKCLGWFLLLVGAIWFAYAIWGIYTINAGQIRTAQQRESIEISTYFSVTHAFDFVILGLLAFSISQLLVYIIRPEVKAGLMLRLADKLCYIYVVVLIVGAFATANSWFANPQFVEVSQRYRMLFIQPLLSPLPAKIILLIGAGVIIRRLLPVIEESKTLV
jgi:glucan phosphoethanolaminetransferase (alkaline phosphatase superfamily)